ncbi:hypothetical protein AB9N12_17525 [Bacteroides sp. AN502(2024)]|uniref:hypothetical protein n=1 Tax=Bacteroides sp. AN502(2024) TaxID=3160599 RepID=UPI003513DBEC
MFFPSPNSPAKKKRGFQLLPTPKDTKEQCFFLHPVLRQGKNAVFSFIRPKKILKNDVFSFIPSSAKKKTTFSACFRSERSYHRSIPVISAIETGRKHRFPFLSVHPQQRNIAILPTGPTVCADEAMRRKTDPIDTMDVQCFPAPLSGD